MMHEVWTLRNHHVRAHFLDYVLERLDRLRRRTETERLREVKHPNVGDAKYRARPLELIELYVDVLLRSLAHHGGIPLLGRLT